MKNHYQAEAKTHQACVQDRERTLQGVTETKDYRCKRNNSDLSKTRFETLRPQCLDSRKKSRPPKLFSHCGKNETRQRQ